MAGSENSVLVSNDRLASWTPAELPWADGEQVEAAALGSADDVGVLAGNEGSVSVAADDLMNWAPVQLVRNEKIIALSLQSGKPFAWTVRTAVGVSFDRSIRPDEYLLNWKPGERVAAAVGSARNEVGLVAGTEGSVRITREDPNIWELRTLQWADSEAPVTAVLSPGGQAGMLLGEKGSVVMMRDGLRNWRPARLTLKERIAAAALGDDGETGVFASATGQVWVTNDGGDNWNPESLALEPGEEVTTAAISEVDRNTVIITGDRGAVFVLRRIPSLERWSTLGPVELSDEMRKDPFLANSDITRSVTEYVAGLGPGAVAPGTPDDVETAADEGLVSDILSDLAFMRIATLAVLFFLVQILVRLYQYSLRLAGFLESRADALSLAQGLGATEVNDLIGLVEAMAPDAYDFKPAPRAALDWWRPRRDQ